MQDFVAIFFNQKESKFNENFNIWLQFQHFIYDMIQALIQTDIWLSQVSKTGGFRPDFFRNRKMPFPGLLLLDLCLILFCFYSYRSVQRERIEVPVTRVHRNPAQQLNNSSSSSYRTKLGNQSMIWTEKQIIICRVMSFEVSVFTNASIMSFWLVVKYQISVEYYIIFVMIFLMFSFNSSKLRKQIS